MAPIHDAVADGDLQEVKRLINAKPILLEAKTNQQKYRGATLHRESTPLMMAVRVGYEETIQWLVDKGAEIGARDEDKENALGHACCHGRVRAVALLLDRGADVNAPSGLLRLTPLMIASCHGHVNVLRILLQRQAQLNLQDRHGWTTHTYSCCHGHHTLTQLLLAKGADPTIANDNGRTPLDKARGSGHQELLKDALSRTRVRLLHKLRSIHDAEHVITKAYDDAASDMPEERRRKAVAAGPAYCKKRIEEEEELPVAEMAHGRRGGEKEIRAAALDYVTAGNKLPREVFIELMIMMLPKEDQERRRRRRGRVKKVHREEKMMGRRLAIMYCREEVRTR